MANQEQLDLLKQRTIHWNRWREQFTDVILDLSNADLSNANLSNADLSNANLSNADLSNANLSNADLSNANLSSSTFKGTILANNNLSTVKGLETIHHLGPSIVDVKSLVLPRGEILTTFLRGMGFSDIFIDYLSSLHQNIVRYYSVFISYSSKDEDFIKRLHTDLQNEGVQCWLALRDLKIGEKIRSGINQSIYLCEKLLLVLSSLSVQSVWVEKEVKTAFDKERRSQSLVLLPIRLDDTILQMTEGWAVDISRQRNIDDFTNWKNENAYQQALKCLLHKLKADKSSLL